MYSLSTFLWTATVATTATAREFGAFAGAQMLYLLTAGVSRAATGQLISIHAHELTETARIVKGALTLLVRGLVPVTGLTLAIASQFGVPLYQLLMIAALPLILCQDALRYAGFSLRRVHVTTLSDALWVIVQVVIMVGVGPNDLTATAATAAWVTGGTAGLVWSLAALRATLVGVRMSARRYLSDFMSDIRPLIASSLLTEAGRFLSSTLVLFFGGLSALGAFRGAMTVLGVVLVLVQGMSLALVPYMSRASGPSVQRATVLSSCFAAGPAVIVAMAAASLPSSLGERLLGSTWLGTTTVIVPVGVWLAVQSSVLGPQSLLMARRQLKRLTCLRLMTLASTAVGLTVGLAIADDTSGAFWWAAVLSGPPSIFWWRGTLRLADSRVMSTKAQSGRSHY